MFTSYVSSSPPPGSFVQPVPSLRAISAAGLHGMEAPIQPASVDRNIFQKGTWERREVGAVSLPGSLRRLSNTPALCDEVESVARLVPEELKDDADR